MTLYINSCVRKESRTNELAEYLLKKIGSDFVEINLEKESLKPISEDYIKKRTELALKGDFSDEMFSPAKMFSQAETIVISAPYWDLSFPSALKVFIENIYVIGLVTKFSQDGNPVGLCRAKKLYYVSTAGGKFCADFGFDYIKTLCQKYLGINEVELILAEMLDVAGSDAKKIITAEKKRIDGMF
ncbi:NAD(P)H-dependent oxidoreductase [Treponema sp.]|uniref:NAD(P)H-dependent oxidoreductase n=1 Tax=Treponema sp. TaxID=166 RepID=UPI003F021D47